MPSITTTVLTDEKTWQGEFYKTLYGENYTDYVSVDRSTDGHTAGILFEHKINLQNTGLDKPLSQALIYLARFNRDGVPVPAKICLVGQEDSKCYVYETSKYIRYINDIPSYANLKASDGIPGFVAGRPSKIINFDMNFPAKGMRDLSDFVEEPAEYVKVTIDTHNVYGWSDYYYNHASDYKQVAKKLDFFNELRNPVGTLKAFIEPWQGTETDFGEIMDMLNDPTTQRLLGAFYTPLPYARKAFELVQEAIDRVPEGNDYVIIDRCAGSGNLELFFTDEMLSHVILSTYELKEWLVLKERYHKRVKYIIPPVPANPNENPELNDDGFLSGANALERDIIDNPEVRKYLDDDHCTVILFENPPYAETTSISFQNEGGAAEASSSWKNSFVVQEMKKEVSGAVLNDIANAFIWSAFKYFLRQPTDSYIVFSPIKYWKAQHLISKTFVDGFAFNRLHFHAKTAACVSCIYWSNEDDTMTTSFELHAFDLDSEHLKGEGNISVKRIYSIFSDKYFDGRTFDDDVNDGIYCGLDGQEKQDNNKSQGKINAIYNPNIVCYCSCHASGFDNPRLTAQVSVATRYNGHGFYVRKDNFLEKLPLLAAARYTDNCNDWKVMSMVMKSGDKAEQYHTDVQSGKLDKFLCQVLIWTGLTHYAHMRSFEGSDGRTYRNELCFDNLDGHTTLAYDALNKYKAAGYKLSEQEEKMFEKWNTILDFIPDCDEYDPKKTYGLYQIDEEINIQIESGVDNKGNPKKIQKYGDLNNYIKDLKALVKQYYISNLVPTLFEYEFLK